MEEDSELSDYPGEDMDGDLGETGQLSPTQTSPGQESDAQQQHMREFIQATQSNGAGTNSQTMKEGGSIENQISESSPEISKTDGYVDGGSSSSLEDSPVSPERQEIDMRDPNLLQNLNRKAQEISEHLSRMNAGTSPYNEESSIEESEV